MLKIEDKFITIKELFEGFKDSEETGVIGYNGRLNIRPKYQREFIYGPIQSSLVIDSITKEYPLGIFHWALNDDGSYEIIDGQQRTLSICKFLHPETRMSANLGGDNIFFHNFDVEQQERFWRYVLHIKVCKGTFQERLEWFARINVAGLAVNDQELLNSNCSGPWLESAKKYFVKSNGGAETLAKNYIKGVMNRCDYLETVLSWISNGKDQIRDYMRTHQKDDNANELQEYFEKVIDWIKSVFPRYDSEMKGLPWGWFYNKYHENNYDSKELQRRLNELMEDDEVQKKSGIYEFLLSGETLNKVLNFRNFDLRQKRIQFTKQDGICPICNKKFDRLDEMEGDHIIPWSKGGKTTSDNIQMLCKACNIKKSNIF